MTDFKPDWTTSTQEKIAIALAIVLPRHIPQWPGATDEQLAAVANDLEEIVTQWDSGDRTKT